MSRLIWWSKDKGLDYRVQCEKQQCAGGARRLAEEGAPAVQAWTMERYREVGIAWEACDSGNKRRRRFKKDEMCSAVAWCRELQCEKDWNDLFNLARGRFLVTSGRLIAVQWSHGGWVMEVETEHGSHTLMRFEGQDFEVNYIKSPK